MKHLRLTLPLLLLISCTDGQLVKVSKALDAVAIGVGQFQTAVITANSQGLIETSTTRTLLDAALKINQGGLLATNAVRQITTLTPADRSNLIKILTPVITAVNTAIAIDIPAIKDPETKQKVQIVLLSIQSSLNTINLILAGGS